MVYEWGGAQKFAKSPCTVPASVFVRACGVGGWVGWVRACARARSARGIDLQPLLNSKSSTIEASRACLLARSLLRKFCPNSDLWALRVTSPIPG